MDCATRINVVEEICMRGWLGGRMIGDGCFNVLLANRHELLKHARCIRKIIKVVIKIVGSMMDKSLSAKVLAWVIAALRF